MKSKNYLGAISLMAALAWSSFGLQGQTYERQHQGRTPQVGRQVERQLETERRYEEERAVERPVARRSNVTAVNQASNLIGMEVRNHRNERLGSIKDLVVDLETGQVSYAVMAVGGFLGMGEKLLALPPQAFARARDQRSLILHADKEAVDQARGFASTNWPDVDQPEWGAEVFWERPEAVERDRAVRTDGITRDREFEGRLDWDRDQTLRERQLRERRLERERQFESQRGARDEERPLARDDRYRDRDTELFRGTIEGIDLNNQMMAVRRGGETLRFGLGEIQRGDRSGVTVQGLPGDLRQLQRGDEVVVRFREDARGELQAVGVTLTEVDRRR
jgi:hypothetical protein